jgi:ElaA protein
MQEGLRMAALTYPGKAVRISAQQYLVRFYSRLGFRTTGEPYDEDGIPHIEMVWRPAHPGGTS